MTPAQLSLLKRLIDADRYYRSAVYRGDPMVSLDWRGVEVGWINGVNPRTAATLEDLGLCELVNLHGNNAFAFLGRYNPYDEEPSGA